MIYKHALGKELLAFAQARDGRKDLAYACRRRDALYASGRRWPLVTDPLGFEEGVW